MGKASRKLSEEKSKYEKTLYHEEHDKTEINEDYLIIKKQNIKQDTIYEIQTKLSSFCHENSYSLCEYLDLDNIENYMDWLL